MRILYFSDIHIEAYAHQTRIYSPWTDLYPLEVGPDVSKWIGEIDLVILAGDIGLGDPLSDLSALLYAEQLAHFLEVPVVFVPGNHEYYGTEFFVARQAMLATRRSGVTVLDRQAATFEFASSSLRIFGATLWTDYSLLGNMAGAMDLARRSISDHRRIAMAGGRAFLPEDAADEHRVSRRWLADSLAEPPAAKTIIVTHHVPHPSVGNPRFKAQDELSPAFQSDCSDLVDAASHAGVSAWIFGHHHACIDREVSGLRLLSAQLGFPREETGWSGPGVLEF